MTKNDIVRIRNTNIICTVIDVFGHNVTVKYNTLNLPVETFLMDELEPFGLQIGDTVKLRGTDYTGTVTGFISEDWYKCKFDVYNAPISIKRSEIEACEPVKQDDILIGCIRQSYGDKLC